MNLWERGPGGWKGEFFPAYVPEGFQLTEASVDNPDYQEATFRGAQHSCYYFTEMTSAWKVMTGIEGSEVTQTVINGQPAYLIDSPMGNSARALTLNWSIGEKMFMLFGWGISRSEIMEIAESAERIYLVTDVTY